MGILLIQVVNTAFSVLVWLIIARCILSFIKHDPYNPLLKFVYDTTEPIMSPFRKLIPSAGGLDFSPIIAVLALTLVQKLLVGIIYTFL